MKRTTWFIAAAAVCLPAYTAFAQAAVGKSRSAGFFIGGALEGDGVQIGGPTPQRKSGGGASALLGYGFSPRWSLYSQFDVTHVATSDAPDHRPIFSALDLGTRIHFRTGPHIVVPFAQAGLTGHVEFDKVGDIVSSSAGGGVSVGGGVNAYFTPALAFSTAVTWTFGNFNSFKVDHETVDRDPEKVTTGRLHLGLVWFPRG
jgi:Outer membrane protein beta-barrel domain